MTQLLRRQHTSPLKILSVKSKKIEENQTCHHLKPHITKFVCICVVCICSYMLDLYDMCVIYVLYVLYIVYRCLCGVGVCCFCVICMCCVYMCVVCVVYVCAVCAYMCIYVVQVCVLPICLRGVLIIFFHQLSCLDPKSQ